MVRSYPGDAAGYAHTLTFRLRHLPAVTAHLSRPVHPGRLARRRCLLPRSLEVRPETCPVTLCAAGHPNRDLGLCLPPPRGPRRQGFLTHHRAPPDLGTAVHQERHDMDGTQHVLCRAQMRLPLFPRLSLPLLPSPLQYQFRPQLRRQFQLLCHFQLSRRHIQSPSLLCPRHRLLCRWLFPQTLRALQRFRPHQHHHL